MKLKYTILTVICLVLIENVASQSLNQIYKQSMQAYKVKDYEKFNQLSLEALKIHPSHPSVLYNVAASYALMNKSKEAKNTLIKLLSWKADVNYEKDSDFEVLLTKENFKNEIIRKKDVFAKQKSTSVLMAEVNKKYHLEDLSWSKNGLMLTDVYHGDVLFYDFKTTTIEKIVSLEGAAMAIINDDKKNCVWATAAVIANYKDYNKEDKNKATLYKINRLEKKIEKEIKIEDKAILGSMVKVKDKIFATNSVTPEIIIIDTKSNKTSSFKIEGAFSLQGITKTEQNDYVYIADYIKGIAKVDIKKQKVVSWLSSDVYLLKGIDGLTYINPTTLIAIQNNSTPKKVVRLTHGNNKITNVKLLDNALDITGEPTNGIYIPKKGYFYVANSQWPLYDKEIKPQQEKWEQQQIRKIQKQDL